MKTYRIYENRNDNYFVAYEVINGIRETNSSTIFVKTPSRGELEFGLKPYPTRESVEKAITEDGDTFEWGN